MKLKALVLMILILSLLTGLFACGNGQDEPTKGDVIVYVATPLSGFQANGGQTIVGGARLKADEINEEEGGLLGYRVVVRGIDDESDNEVAAAVAAEIADAITRGEKVLGVIGHLNSGQTWVGMEIYQNLPIVVVTPTASDMALTQSGYRNFFRVNAHNTAQARVAADYLVNQFGAQRVAVLYNDDSYGIDLGQRTIDALQALGPGIEVVLNRQVQVEQDQFDTEIAALQQANPDAIFYAGYEVECPYLRADLRDAGLDGIPFLASDGCFLSETIDASDDAAEGMYVIGFAPQPQAVAGTEWIKAYQQVEYRNPDTYSVNGYTAMEVLAEGAKKANSLEGPKVAEAIRQLSFDSLIGAINYDNQGDLEQQRLFIFQVQQDSFEQVAP
jgi:branched-chain amino acid transport system substrate-binding protein